MAALWQRQVHGPCNTSYPYIAGRHLLGQVGNWLRHVTDRERSLSRVALVTNGRVGPLHADRVLTGLRSAGLDGFVVEIPDGEQHKTPETVTRIYDELLVGGLDRYGMVLTLGGGVVGDTAGFAAATYLRGVALAHLPTSLLAMVDASIGGKVGVDLPQGKNLVGAFHQPRLVLADTDCLSTLPRAEFAAGMAEVVKAALIGDAGLFEQLEAPLPVPGEMDRLAGIIGRTAAVKIDIVEADPLETGRRAVLNLGHTFAHALEAQSGYTLRHGEAVAVGLVAAARLSALLGQCDAAWPERIARVLTRLELPTSPPGRGYEPEAVLAAMGTDKKRAGGRLRLVLLHQAGEVFVSQDVPVDAVRRVLQELL